MAAKGKKSSGDNGVQVELSESLTLNVTQNAFLEALLAGPGKFNTSKPTSYESFRVAKVRAANSVNLSIEHASAILKAALPIELGRQGGVFTLPRHKRDMESILRKQLEGGGLNKFLRLFEDYIVPVHRWSPDLITAERNAPNEIPVNLRGKGKVPALDPTKTQMFLLKLALPETDSGVTRQQWLETTILDVNNPGRADKYLAYLDEAVAEIGKRFDQLKSEEGAVKTLEKSLETLKRKITTLHGKYEPLARDDPERKELKKTLHALQEEYKELAEKLEEAREKLAKRKAKLDAEANKANQSESDAARARILRHGIAVTNLAIVLDDETDEEKKKKKTNKKPSKKNDEDDEPEDEDEEEEEQQQEDDDDNDDDAANNTTAATAHTPKERLGKYSINMENVELLPFNLIKRINAAAYNIHRTNNNNSGIPKEWREIFAIYGTLRSSAMVGRNTTIQKSITQSVFPDQYTLDFEPFYRPAKDAKGAATPRLFAVTLGGDDGEKIYFPIFDIRTLLTNYILLSHLRNAALEKQPTASNKSSAKNPIPAAKKSGKDVLNLSVSSDHEGDEKKKKKKKDVSDESSSSSSQEEATKSKKSQDSKKKKDASSDDDSSSDEDDDKKKKKQKKKKEASSDSESDDKKKKKKDKKKKKQKKEESSSDESSSEDDKKKKKKKQKDKKKQKVEESSSDSDDADKKKKKSKKAPLESSDEDNDKKKKPSKPIINDEEPTKKKKKENEAEVVKISNTKKKSSAAVAVEKHDAIDLSISKEPSSDSEMKQKENDNKKKKANQDAEEKKPEAANKKRKVIELSGDSDEEEEEKKVDISEERAHKDKKAKKEEAVAKKPKPVAAASKKRPAAAIELSNNESSESGEKDKKKPSIAGTAEVASIASTKPPPTKKAREGEAKPAQEPDDTIVFDDKETEQMMLQQIMHNASWNFRDLVEVDSEQAAMITEETNQLLSLVEASNFHAVKLGVNTIPTNDELETAHRSFALIDEPQQTATLLRAAIVAYNLKKLPLMIASGVLGKAASIETEYENAAQDFVSKPSGHTELANLVATAVNSIDLVLRYCESEKYQVHPLIEASA